MTRIYNPYENSIFINSVRPYIDYKIKNTLKRIDINLITFKERAYNQHKYAIILTYKAIITKQNYTFTYKDNIKNYIKKFNKIIQIQYKRTIRVQRVDNGKKYKPN